MIKAKYDELTRLVTEEWANYSIQSKIESDPEERACAYARAATLKKVLGWIANEQGVESCAR